MGLINDAATKLGFNDRRPTNVPPAFGPDFPGGFKIIEYVNGKQVETITLAGTFMPVQPFKFGGKQEIKKEYYPGNSEPTVQIMGPRETDITITGRLKLKKIGDPSKKDASLKDVAYEYQKLLDAMRIRGNMVKIQMGDWYRYGFIETTDFDMNRKVDIAYSITFSIVGFNVPKNSMFLGQTDESPVVANKQLTSKTAELLAASKNYPSSMPTTIADTLNGYINGIATEIAKVTGFVDGILGDVEALNASANRALGLIKNARSYISATSRRVGQIATTTGNLGASFSSEALKTSAQISNVAHLHKIQQNNFNLAAFLAELQFKFKNIVATTPFKRHLVRQGDNLQKISTLYFNTPDNWSDIQKHNKLQSTELVTGSILEIPRL